MSERELANLASIRLQTPGAQRRRQPIRVGKQQAEAAARAARFVEARAAQRQAPSPERSRAQADAANRAIARMRSLPDRRSAAEREQDYRSYQPRKQTEPHSTPSSAPATPQRGALQRWLGA